jgi:hypothetical protein
MKMNQTVRMLLAGILLAGLTGCAMFNYTKGTLQYSRTTTIGRELMDLQEAREKGAISEAEYNQCKKNLIESNAAMATNAAMVAAAAEKQK